MEHVVGLCYHPPKPLYQSTLLIDTIKQDLDTITHQNPNAVISLYLTATHTVRTTDENYLRCLQLQPALSKVQV